MTPDLKALLIEGFRPPWMDKEVLGFCTCFGSTTIDTHVATGVLPPPRKRGGKLMWKWSEVDEWLTVGKPAEATGDDKAERIRNAPRRTATAGPAH